MTWGLLWYSRNRLDGVTRYLLYANGLPLLFRTRQEARRWRDENYGYIRDREDLRAEPHGWRLPAPIKVELKW